MASFFNSQTMSAGLAQGGGQDGSIPNSPQGHQQPPLPLAAQPSQGGPVRHDPYGVSMLRPGETGENMPQLMSPPEIDLNAFTYSTSPTSPDDPILRGDGAFANAFPPAGLRLASQQSQLNSPPIPSLSATPGGLSLSSPSGQLPMSPGVGPPVLLSPTTPPQSPGSASASAQGGTLVSFLPGALQPKRPSVQGQQPQPQQHQHQQSPVQNAQPHHMNAPIAATALQAAYPVVPLSPTSAQLSSPQAQQHAPQHQAHPQQAPHQQRSQRRGHARNSASPDSHSRSPVHSAAVSPTTESPKGGNRRNRNFSSKGGRKLFIGQLPKTTTRAALNGLMEQYGQIEDLHLIVDRNTGKGTGAAFLVYVNPDSAMAAVRDLHNKVKLPNMETFMQVRLAEGEVPADRDVKLFVGQVPTCCDESHLSALFGKYPELLEVAVLRKDGKSRGCAFVRYGQKSSAEGALRDLDGKATLQGGQLPLSVKYANTEAEKRRKREDKDKPKQGVVSPQGDGLQNAQQLHVAVEGGGVQWSGDGAITSPPLNGHADPMVSPQNALRAQAQYNPQVLQTAQVGAAMINQPMAQMTGAAGQQMNAAHLQQIGLTMPAGAFPPGALNQYQLQAARGQAVTTGTAGAFMQQQVGLQQPNIYLAGGSQPKFVFGPGGQVMLQQDGSGGNQQTQAAGLVFQQQPQQQQQQQTQQQPL